MTPVPLVGICHATVVVLRFYSYKILYTIIQHNQAFVVHGQNTIPGICGLHYSAVAAQPNSEGARNGNK